MPRTVKSTRLSDIPMRYLLCRDRAIGHDWEDGATHSADPFNIVWETSRRKDGGQDLVRLIRCVRCGKIKRVPFSHGHSGYLKRSGAVRYTKTPATYSPRTSGRVRPEEVTTELFLRTRMRASS